MKISRSDEGPFLGAHIYRSRHTTPDALITCNLGLGPLSQLVRYHPREIIFRINPKLVLKENLMEARGTFWQHTVLG